SSRVVVDGWKNRPNGSSQGVNIPIALSPSTVIPAGTYVAYWNVYYVLGSESKATVVEFNPTTVMVSPA
ncbi:MAG: hypothetical protein AAFN81_33345, partial [Bacteroidota bacterium]